MSERTLVLIKPDGVERGLIGESLSRIERRGLRIVALKMVTIDEATAAAHYAEHEGKPFYRELVDFITSGPLVAAVVEGDNAVAAWRQMIGATDPVQAAPGSLRADFATIMNRNLVHGSDSPENGIREAKIFFPDLD